MSAQSNLPTEHSNRRPNFQRRASLSHTMSFKQPPQERRNSEDGKDDQNKEKQETKTRGGNNQTPCKPADQKDKDMDNEPKGPGGTGASVVANEGAGAPEGA